MQEIVNIRIDERLIHGQVAAFWTNNLKASRILVVDDLAAQDEIQKMALKMACPTHVKLSILPIARAVRHLKAEKYEGDRVFVVLKGPETCVKMWDLGWRFNEVNVGNMASGPGTKLIKRGINITEEDIVHFRKLDALGVKFSAQRVPDEDKIDFMPLLPPLKI
jgi:PTS system mannose-specific IIB component